MTRKSNYWLVLLTLFYSQMQSSGSEWFDESFDGTGEFFDQDNSMTGFDNPNWIFFGNGHFENDGLRLVPELVFEDAAFSSIEMLLNGEQSFSEEIRLRDLELRTIDEGRVPRVVFRYFPGRDPSSRLGFTIFPIDEDANWDVFFWKGSTADRFLLPAGNDFDFRIDYDHDLSEVSFQYKVDDQSPVHLGPFPFAANFDSRQRTHLISSYELSGVANVTIDNWSLLPLEPRIIRGDFDNDRELTVLDIDLLSEKIRIASDELLFDLNSDKEINQLDQIVWVHELANTYFGDSNLDGEFNSGDLVAVFKAGEFEDDVDANSTWAAGDWNGDADFTTSDLVVAFEFGGYEAGPREAIAPVPEPACTLPLLGLCLLPFRCRTVRAPLPY